MVTNFHANKEVSISSPKKNPQQFTRTVAVAPHSSERPSPHHINTRIHSHGCRSVASTWSPVSAPHNTSVSMHGCRSVASTWSPVTAPHKHKSSFPQLLLGLHHVVTRHCTTSSRGMDALSEFIGTIFDDRGQEPWLIRRLVRRSITPMDPSARTTDGTVT